ncbi:MAG: adenosylcobinamide-GDP ribazoletransferase [Firmicutes bacterium]|nr:adenosylcobinamide-GDP ribazoletransferase [Bacillota bacterium]
MKHARAAIRLLTAIPVGDAVPVTPYAAAWFWLPGLLASAVWYLAFHIFEATGVGMIAAVGGEAILTGGRVWQGWASLFDMWGTSKDRRIEVRRAAGAGAVGTLATGLALLALWTLWEHGGNLTAVMWMLPPLWARAVMAWGVSWRRTDPSSVWLDQLRKTTAYAAGAWVTLLIAIGFGVLAMGFEAIALLGLILVAMGAFLWWAQRLSGGMNETVLNAAMVLTEILTLYLLVAVVQPVLF